ARRLVSLDSHTKRNTMTPTPEEVAAMIRSHMVDADVEVRLYAGDDHFEATVISSAFAGKSRVAQHQMVYAALGEHMKQAIHALALKTAVPKE
ncbi:MAG: BolA family protein, partial [Mariprofundus sp.]|nr:BolA family protein [Mariprofundus sp.]